MSNKLEKQSIYDIFRACRLCGAGGGYKMPIIQSVLPFVSSDVELKQKIRECLQIEVKEDDKMPPLICELCMDKVNDFYEFLDMCRGTNKRTRLRLGLPPQDYSQGVTNTEDCILGVTEQIFPKTNQSETITKTGQLKQTLVRTVRVNKDDSDKRDKGKKGMEWSVKESKEVKSGKGKKDEKKSGKKEETRKAEGGRRWQKEDDMMDAGRPSRSSCPVSRSSSTSSRSRVASPPAPQRETRRYGANDSDTVSLNRLRHQELQNKSEKPLPKPILKKEKDIKKEPLSDDDSPLLVPRGKRTRDKDVVKLETQPKKVKLNVPPSPPPKASTKPGPKPSTKPGPKPSTKPGPKVTEPASKASAKPGPKVTELAPKASAKPGQKVTEPAPKASSKPGPKFSKTGPKPSTKPGPKFTKSLLPAPPPNTCGICQQTFKNTQAWSSHMRWHTVTFTKPTLACDPCGEWFESPDEVAKHHARHRWERLPYVCRHCERSFKDQNAYDEHIPEHCVPAALHKRAVPKEKGHRCSNCNQVYSTGKRLKIHQWTCLKKKEMARPKSESKVKISPSLKRKLLPAQVRLARCDELLESKRGRYDVSNLPPLFGLDRNCVYPYLYSGVHIKSERLETDGMVSIKQDIKDEFYKEEDYVHWDSDMSTDSEEDETDSNLVGSHFAKAKKVESLTALSLKTIFSKRCLGKVPRKLRKVKSDKLFDSLFNANEFENDFNLNNSINNIIGSLGDESATVNVPADSDSSKVIFNDGASTIVNYDSDSVLDPDSSILGVTNNDFDSLFKNDDSTSQTADAGSNDKDKSKDIGKNCVDTVNNVEETDTPTHNVDSTVNNVFNTDDIDKDDKKDDDKDTMSLNSQISNRTDHDSVGQNGDLKTNDNSESEQMNGNTNDNDNCNDVTSGEVENTLLGEFIGGSETKNKAVAPCESEKDKLTLDDIVSNRDLKSLDLDNISDEEYNFDV